MGIRVFERDMQRMGGGVGKMMRYAFVFMVFIKMSYSMFGMAFDKMIKLNGVIDTS